MKDKIKRFSVPKGYGICPVLVYLGEVAQSISESQYFYRMIHLEDLLLTNS
jgi:hypothetical protein